MREHKYLGTLGILALAAAAAFAAGAGSQVLTSHRTVGWGWGCGGHCAVNISGESDTTLGNGPPDVFLEDRGKLVLTHQDPGGTEITTTQWAYTFRGTRNNDSHRREYQLKTDVADCRRTDESLREGKPPTKKGSTCPGPPPEWKLVCERREVQVKAEMQPAWVCFPAEHMAEFGTQFPWVFGLEQPITTVISGEPQARTTYEPTPPPARQD